MVSLVPYQTRNPPRIRETRGRALGAMGAPAWTYGLTRGGAGGGQLLGAGAGYRASGGR
jgi:hypothetical protein